ncbi:MAG: cob(I)yrinic acid a,c-diamide adenosyltransferase [Brumimicrobium sp.]
MKVYTKRGDSGTTSLIGGKRVSKNDLRIDSYGTVDELNSWVGLLRDQDDMPKAQFEELIEIQDRLFTIGSLLATQPEGTSMNLPKLYQEDIDFLERAIDKMDEDLPKVYKFVLPGGKPILSYCHIARTVCRRAERLTVGLEDNSEQHKLAIKYLNRLSDYLFVLSRKIATALNIEEIQWKPRTESSE